MCALQVLLQVESVWLSRFDNWTASYDFGLGSLEIKGILLMILFFSFMYFFVLVEKI